ncbi:unnamed protein product, partial [Soboliphyme baturini]|uniref:ANAPC5 domain-containing protein n=1 Tax=Soboliphyme baturini TaxID=241478 RepID=A0A183JAA0_9BILA
MYEDALKTFLQCVEFHKERGTGVSESVDQMCGMYACIGDAYLGLQQIAAADQAYDQMLRLARILNSTSAEIDALTRLGRLKRYKASRRWAEKQLDIALKLGDRLMEADACSALGDVEFEVRRFGNAAKLYQKRLELVSSGGCPIKHDGTMLQALHRLGTCHYLNGSYDEALSTYRSALRLAEESESGSNERSLVCMLHADLAFCLLSLSRSADAVKHMSLHWTLSRDTVNSKVRSMAFKNVGRYYAKCGEYKKCIEYMEKYLMIVQEENELSEELESCLILGDAHRKLACYLEAVRFYNQALTMAKDTSNYTVLANAYRSLAVSKMKLHEFNDAMECAKYFLAIAHILGNAESKCDALLTISEILLLTGKPKASLKVIGKAMNLIIAASLNHLQRKTLGLLGLNYLTLEKYREAMSVFWQEKALAEQTKNSDDLCSVCEHLGAYFRAQNQVDQALQEYRKQASIAKATNNLEKQLDAWWNMAETQIRAKNLDEARRCFQRHADLMILCGGGDRSFTAVRKALLKVADLLERQKRWLSSAKCYERLLSLPLGDDAEERTMAPVLRVRLGWMMVRLLRFERARTEFLSCLKQNSTAAVSANESLAVRLYQGLAYCEAALGDTKSSLARLTTLLTD